MTTERQMTWDEVVAEMVRYRERASASGDLLRQAIDALRGLVADDITYDGRIVKIECVNHTDAIAKVISARAVLTAYDKREQL